MIHKISIINISVCIILLFLIYLISFRIDPEFAKFTLGVCGFGFFLAWACSPKHNILDGIRSLSIIEWLLVAWPLVLLVMIEGIPYSHKPMIIVCAIIGGVGFMIAK